MAGPSSPAEVIHEIPRLMSLWLRPCLFLSRKSRRTTANGLIGEHEAFLVWYAKQKGWDKEAGLDIRMLRFGPATKSPAGDYQRKSRMRAVPTSMPPPRYSYVVCIGNDESDLNAIYVRPDSPKAKGELTPVIPDVYGSGHQCVAAHPVPGKTSALSASYWLKDDVKIQNLPGPVALRIPRFETFPYGLRHLHGGSKGLSGLPPASGLRHCQPILLLADRRQEILNRCGSRVQYLRRRRDAMHSEGFDAFVQEYPLQ